MISLKKSSLLYVFAFVCHPHCKDETSVILAFECTFCIEVNNTAAGVLWTDTVHGLLHVVCLVFSLVLW